MRQSKLFTKTRREAPKDEISKNAELLIRAGFIHKEMAGVYDFLPLGLLVIEKIKNIVREEMDKIGGQEIQMSSLQRKELWERTDRWSDKNVDVWFKSKLNSGGEVGFGWSHEEPITDMMKNYIGSYRDLPIYPYQFQSKLRNELRAKSGIMRGREFLMKDMYSYTTDEKSHQEFYDSVIEAYHRIFEKLGIGDITYLTLASGGAFTQFSHEFQTITESGEDVIYLEREKKIAVNKEVLNDEVLKKEGIERGNLEEVKAAEVGNIFDFKDIKSKELGLYFKDEKGEEKPVHLGSYGIGITRIMGTIAEIFSDDKGLVWPKNISPFDVHLISVGAEKSEAVKTAVDKLYDNLNSKGLTVLYDDRDLRPGEKFADSDLIGIPTRFIISEKTLEQGKIEVKDRETGKVEMLEEEDAVSILGK
ncbi:MAG: prolyl-tRNA synthetase [Parcubacteria group bacterium CG11_big_fil_rev_8_21_14_0_20_39_22]|nr:MAG: prolyl-tRNA synthetase [Parcubacteria group bacterium CG11_big_fil_rev_8_21_14_0_20_39_22]